MLLSKETITTQILDFLREKSPLIAKGEYTNDTNFFNEGILDSLAFIDLVTFIEDEYEISLNDEAEITTATFGSLSQIYTIVIQSLAKHNKLQ